ncbi:Fis family transcriptional regulator [Vibrio makurazakiensis]|uniref:Fis family transcriptional regulator n=1 Tax=Vibrio makurazakiensis TaxID=2910250 RepID=UPI003D097E7E
MRKTDKKIDNQLRDTLTDICEGTLKGYEGFLWVTHLANFSNFPQSLKIVCVFETNQQRDEFSQHQQQVNNVIKNALSQVGITLKNIEKHVKYDTQENCDRENRGKWDLRL